MCHSFVGALAMDKTNEFVIQAAARNRRRPVKSAKFPLETPVFGRAAICDFAAGDSGKLIMQLFLFPILTMTL
jgi:hypothetical protein